MTWWHREPTLKELVADPVFVAVMKADGVDQSEFEAMLKQLSRKANDSRNVVHCATAE